MGAGGKRETILDDRRNFLAGMIRLAGTLLTAALIFPLFRFLGFTIQPKPRHIMVAAPLPASGVHMGRDFILFVGKDKPLAISRTCTHLGCRVNFLEDQQIIECPCHQSRFTTGGKLISGPAKKDLPTFVVEVKTDETGTISGYMVTI